MGSTTLAGGNWTERGREWPLTAVERASPPDPADGFVGSVGVWRGGGDQVVVRVAVEPRLLGRRILRHLEEEENENKNEKKRHKNKKKKKKNEKIFDFYKHALLTKTN